MLAQALHQKSVGSHGLPQSCGLCRSNRGVWLRRPYSSCGVVFARRCAMSFCRGRWVVWNLDRVGRWPDALGIFGRVFWGRGADQLAPRNTGRQPNPVLIPSNSRLISWGEFPTKEDAFKGLNPLEFEADQLGESGVALEASKPLSV